ncbi:tRNA modification GTPase MnmE, partial [Smittium mucronatum]
MTDGNRVAPRMATLKKIVDPLDPSRVLDVALLICFKGPKSYTGEDMAEFHLHGGTAIVQAVLDSLSKIPGCKMARAGEFSER